MRYDIRVSHVAEDYTISDEGSELWACRIGDPGDLKLLLNRVAIATTQYSVVDFPEVRIS